LGGNGHGGIEGAGDMPRISKFSKKLVKNICFSFRKILKVAKKDVDEMFRRVIFVQFLE